MHRDLSGKIQEEFDTYCNISTLSTEDLYVGRICAALDRQHPRDLFDIKYLVENEGLTDKLRKTFIAYLLSHPRPIQKLIKPNQLDSSEAYAKEFRGMVNEEVSLETLIKYRKKLIESINKELTIAERQFLISFQNVELI